MRVARQAGTRQAASATQSRTSAPEPATFMRAGRPDPQFSGIALRVTRSMYER